VVDHLATARYARETLWALRRDPDAREEARRVFDKHGSRNPAREGRRPAKAKTSATKKDEPAPTPQLSLGLE
jgi:deoxyribodipyrimidine photo-lyase